MRALTFFASMLAAAPSFAQAVLAPYEPNQRLTIKGPVTRIEWSNPSAYIFVNSTGPTGTTTSWAIDIGNPLDLERSGWKSDTVHIGDLVSVDANPSRVEQNRARAIGVHGGTGFSLSLFTQKPQPAFTPKPQPSKAQTQPAPTWPNGQVRLGPAPNKKGYWAVPSTTILTETTVPTDRDGILKNLSDADKVAPFLPWARSVFEYRQRTFLKDDPLNRCLPPGGPRQFQTPNGFQFIEQPELGRILVLLGGGDRNWRVIYTDGRPPVQSDDVVSTYYGTSTGKWENKNTLVVDSVGFNEKFWISSNGLPHTEALHLTERFTRSDLNTLKYEVTVNDPRTYSRPWKAAWTIQWAPDEDMQEYFCEENVESTLGAAKTY